MDECHLDPSSYESYIGTIRIRWTQPASRNKTEAIFEEAAKRNWKKNAFYGITYCAQYHSAAWDLYHGRHGTCYRRIEVVLSKAEKGYLYNIFYRWDKKRETLYK